MCVLGFVAWEFQQHIICYCVGCQLKIWFLFTLDSIIFRSCEIFMKIVCSKSLSSMGFYAIDWSDFPLLLLFYDLLVIWWWWRMCLSMFVNAFDMKSIENCMIMTTKTAATTKNKWKNKINYPLIQCTFDDVYPCQFQFSQPKFLFSSPAKPWRIVNLVFIRNSNDITAASIKIKITSQLNKKKSIWIHRHRYWFGFL